MQQAYTLVTAYYVNVQDPQGWTWRDAAQIVGVGSKSYFSRDTRPWQVERSRCTHEDDRMHNAEKTTSVCRPANTGTNLLRENQNGAIQQLSKVTTTCSGMQKFTVTICLLPGQTARFIPKAPLHALRIAIPGLQGWLAWRASPRGSPKVFGRSLCERSRRRHQNRQPLTG